MGTGCFPRVKSGRGVRLTPHPLLVPWSWKGRAIPLLPLWAVRPVQRLSHCTRVRFTLYLYTSTRRKKLLNDTAQPKKPWIFNSTAEGTSDLASEVSLEASFLAGVLTSLLIWSRWGTAQPGVTVRRKESIWGRGGGGVCRGLHLRSICAVTRNIGEDDFEYWWFIS